MNETVAESPEKPPESSSPKAEFFALAARAQNGDRSVLPQLRALLDSHPEIWTRYGDLAAHALDAWIRLSAGTNVGLREALTRKIAALRAELAGPAPSLLERLLAERAAANWLQLHHAEAAVTQARPETPLKVMDHLEKRHERAHRRYLQSLGALTTVRRLLPNAGGQEQIPAHTAVADRVIDVENKAETSGTADVGLAVSGATTAADEAALARSTINPSLTLFDPQRTTGKPGDSQVPAQRRQVSSMWRGLGCDRE